MKENLNQIPELTPEQYTQGIKLAKEIKKVSTKVSDLEMMIYLRQFVGNNIVILNQQKAEIIRKFNEESQLNEEQQSRLSEDLFFMHRRIDKQRALFNEFDNARKWLFLYQSETVDEAVVLMIKKERQYNFNSTKAVNIAEGRAALIQTQNKITCLKSNAKLLIV